MEDINENMYDNEEDEEEVEYNLPKSKPSGLEFKDLYKNNQIYSRQLSKLLSNDNRFKSKVLPYNDMKVLNSLLKENLIYLNQLLKYKNFQIEFDNLYNISMEILDLLGQLGQSKINVYQKCQKLKFMEMKFQNLRISGREIDYANADALLGEMEKIQYDITLKNYISELDIGTLNMNRALVKFCVCDFYLAKEYALNALSVMDKKNPLNNPKNITINKEDDVENDKYIQKIAQVHEFLAELYDLEKDYKNALSSYEKCYYLYIGRFGINHPLVAPYKRKKELYQKKVENMNNEKNIRNYEDELVRKLKSGKITSSKGKSDTFSFIVPGTEISEPLLIKIFALPKYIGDNDYFSNYLFLKNIYFDKMKLFEYLGIYDEYRKQNYVLYTDDALNIILEKIKVIDNKFITFTDPKLYTIFINC